MKFFGLKIFFHDVFCIHTSLNLKQLAPQENSEKYKKGNLHLADFLSFFLCLNKPSPKVYLDIGNDWDIQSRTVSRRFLEHSVVGR